MTARTSAAAVVAACAIALSLAGCSAPSDAAAPLGQGSTAASDTPTRSASAPQPSAVDSSEPSQGMSTTSAKPRAHPAAERTDIGTVRLPAADAGEQVTTAEGVVVSVDGRSDMHITGTGPGEVDGAGVAVTVHVRNGGDATLDLDGVAVNAFFGKVPASPSDSAPWNPLHGQLASKDSASGVYVFRVPSDASGPMTVVVESNASTDVVVVEP